MFKPVKGESGSAAFLPISQKLGGNHKTEKDNRNSYTHRDCLVSQQTDFMYKKVELGSLINRNMIYEELDADIELDKMDDNSGDKNLYKELIVNNAFKTENALPQMEQWPIPSNVINYIQYSKNPKNIHSMTIRPVKSNTAVKDMKGRNINKSLLEVNLVDILDRSK